MPKEFRKRGKKAKRSKIEKGGLKPEHQDETSAGPSWIISTRKDTEEPNPEAPFGSLDNDVKAYFRTVDVQIRNWQENEVNADDRTADVDPNEERKLFFIAALSEMSGKEKQLAADPDCSNILERMIHSMDDFARRVFVDRLAGSYEALMKHRFASHVCQTMFTVASETIAREERGVLPSGSDFGDEGELRTLTDLIVSICKEIYANFTSLVMDPFASHVIRALLLLLSPTSRQAEGSNNSKSRSSLRSKKSVTWKARQAPMKNVFSDLKGKTAEDDIIRTPEIFREAAEKFVRIVRDELDANEVRALAADKVASPVLQMLLGVEADQGISDSPDSLMDRVLVGIITFCNEDPTSIPDQSDYLSTLFRDPTSSHLLETLVTRTPEGAFKILWKVYFQGKLGRLATHPVANFVVARAIERVDGEQLRVVCGELGDSFGKIIESSRSGVLRAIVDRAAALHDHEAAICEAMCNAFDLTNLEDRKFLVPCVMTLKPLVQYQAAKAQKEGCSEQTRDKEGPKALDPLEPSVQGAILLQSLLRFNTPHNQVVLDSITSLPTESLLHLAQNPTSSRVLDAILESPTIPHKSKRNLVLSFIGHYHTLVDDRIGSRVGDRCWGFADPYLREKIARSLVKYEQFLAGSFYGKFFSRHLNFYLLQRNPDEWKNMQSQSKYPFSTQPATLSTSNLSTEVHNSTKSTKRKLSTDPENEIDALFSAKLGKKVKRAVLDSDEPAGKMEVSQKVAQMGLDDVLGAIRSAPKDDKSRHRKKKRTK